MTLAVDAWTTYCEIEQTMFETGAAYIAALGLTVDDLEEVLVTVDAVQTDVEPLIEMILGRKEAPTGWRVPR